MTRRLSDTLAGLKELSERVKKLPDVARPEAAKALYQFAREKVEAVAIDRAPMMDGILRGTIETLPPKVDGKKVEVSVVAGGPSAPYAIAVHEHLSEHSPPTWQKAEENGDGVHFQVGGPKYLESALNDAVPALGQDVAKRFEIKNVWEKTK